MHICILTRLTLTHGICGGMERHASILMRRLQDRGHRLSLITTAKPQSVEMEQESAERIWYLANAASARYTTAWWWESFQAVMRLQQRDPIDVIWSQSIAGLGYLERIPSGKQALPFVAIMHGTAAGELRTRYHTLRRSPSLRQAALLLFYLHHYLHDPRRWKAVMDKISALIAVSPAVAADLRNHLGAPPAKVQCIPNGIDINRFRPDETQRAQIRKSLGVSDVTPVLMTASRLSQDKGIQLAISAITRLPEAHLMILGGGAYQQRLRALSESFGVTSRVHFLGMVPYEAMNSYLNAADIFLYPSLREEAFPLSIIEAMATGVPVIASEVGGVPTAITDGVEGCLVSPGEIYKLEARISKLLSDHKLLKQMGSAARKKAIDQFSLAQMTERTEAIFMRAVARE